MCARDICSISFYKSKSNKVFLLKTLVLRVFSPGLNSQAWSLQSFRGAHVIKHHGKNPERQQCGTADVAGLLLQPFVGLLLQTIA